MTKQEQIDRLTAQVAELCNVISELRREADRGFEASPEYRRMKTELLLAGKVKDYEDRIRREKKADLKLLEEVRSLREDNRRLCEALGEDEYRIGMTRGYFDRDGLEAQILNLKASLAAKEEIISHLKAILAGEDPETPKAPVMGKPRIDEETRKRVRKFRRAGWTMSQIADAEGISKGSVHAICHEKLSDSR